MPARTVAACCMFAKCIVVQITVKAGRRLHFLKLLKRSSVACDGLLHYYKSIIRPVLEYACPLAIWVTVEQRDRLESVQRRALHLISGSTDNEAQCVLLDIEPMCVSIDNLARSFFHRICDPADCLNYLLPSERSIETVNIVYVILIIFLVLPVEQIVFLKSFLPYALSIIINFNLRF
jgi:hypothetical protein